MGTVHIIGAGLAGLSAAVALVKTDHRVCLYESTAQAGGRCRSYSDPVIGRTIDNGNHLILAGNRHAMDYIERIGAGAQFHSVQRDYPFNDLRYGGSWTLSPPRYLPRVPLIDYWSLAIMGWRGGTVAQSISPHSQIFRRMVEPLCISILNTQPQKASARLLARCLRHARRDATPLVPIDNLHEALVAPALHYIHQHDGEVYYQQSLKRIVADQGLVTELQFTRNQVTLSESDQVILAIPPHGVGKLLPNVTVPREYHAIVNAHFAYAHGQPNGSFRGAVGTSFDWVFFKDGILSTTTSAADAIAEMDQDMVAQSIWRDVCTLMQWDAPIPPHRLVTEKRATMAASVANLALRPSSQTEYGNLLLAGDYVKSPFPATIEGAIASGMAAARVISGI